MDFVSIYMIVFLTTVLGFIVGFAIYFYKEQKQRPTGYKRRDS
jgi:uncharacterized membrane protein